MSPTETATTDHAPLPTEMIPPEPVRYEMAVMGRTGDTKVLWDPSNPDEVAAARAQFNALVAEKKFLAFAVKKKGGQGEQVRTFDPAAGSLILIPPMAGG